MDLFLLIGIATALLVVLLTLFFFQKKSAPKEESEQQQRQVPARAQEGVPRRAQIARNQRNRLRNTVAEAPQQEEDASDEDVAQAAVFDDKMGAKKRAKLEAKAEKKNLREAELKIREDKKKKEAQAEEEKLKLDEKAAEEEKKVLEAEKRAREEKERQEHEEYLKMKEAFSVEEEGYEEGDDDEKENLLADFIQYIKDNKVVVLEDLATQFKLKTQAAIDRINDLQENGSITGVIDDRGKFIYISEDELKAVAKFIKQRGRVSISELAESSASLINLIPIS